MNNLHSYKHIKSIRREFYVAEESQISAKEIVIQTTNDNTLFSGKRIMLIFDKNVYFKNKQIWCTYYRTHVNGNRSIIEKLILDEPYTESLPVGTTISYYTSFTVSYDNEALTETDAKLRLVATESEYGESTDINMPFDYKLEGKSGLISPEDLYKLKRLQSEAKFTNIQFSSNTMKPVALIRIEDSDFNITPYSISAIIDTKLSAKITLFYDKISVNGSFISVDSFWSNDKNLIMSVAANTEIRNEKKYLRIQVAFSQEQIAKIAVSVQNLQKLENANLGEDAPQTGKNDLLFAGATNAQIYDQIIGYSYSSRYALPMQSEVIYLPKEIVSGDLNDFKESGYYFGQEDTGNLKNIVNRPSVNQNPLECSFRLEVQRYSTNGPVYQKFIGFETHPYIHHIDENGSVSEQTPRIYERIFANDIWSSWLEVGRLEHSHMLEDLGESPNSLHFTQAILDIINGLGQSSTDTPWKSPRLTSIDQLTPSSYRNGDVVSLTSGGIYQLVNGAFKRVDIDGLYVFDINDAGTNPNQTGLISRKLYEQIFSNTFMKKLNDNNSYILVSNDNSWYSNSLQNVFDFVKRSEYVLTENNTLHIGFGNTLAKSEKSIAIGTNVSQENMGVSIGNDINSYGIGSFGNGLEAKNNQLVFGKFNNPITSEGFIFGFGSNSENKKTVGYLDSEGYLHINGVKYFSESDIKTDVKNNPNKYLLKADGNYYDSTQIATVEQIEELKNTKLDKGNSSIIIFETTDGEKYPFVFALDPDIVQIQGVNGNNIVVAFSAYYVQFLEESIRIVIEDLNADNPYVNIGTEVSASGQSQNVEATFNEETQLYEVLDFSSSISSEKMGGLGITNYPTKFDFNTYIVTYKNGETLDLSQYFNQEE